MRPLILASSRPLRLATLTALYFAQGVPIGLLTIALPAWLAQRGLGGAEIAAYQGIVGLPWGLKLVSGPLMDRFSFPAMGRRRPWVPGAQAGLTLAFAALSLVRDPLAQLPLVIGLGPQMRSENAKLEREYAEKLNMFKPDWPAMKQLKSQIEKGKQHLNEEIGRQVTKAREMAPDYQTALRREESRKAVLDGQKTEAMTLNRNAVEFTPPGQGPKLGRDPIRQEWETPTVLLAPTPQPSLSFDGTSDDDNAAVTGGRVVPPDTNGDVGPNHYIQMNNSVFEIFEKQGNTLLGPCANNALWSGFGGICQTNNDGDPIVFHDQLANR